MKTKKILTILIIPMMVLTIIAHSDLISAGSKEDVLSRYEISSGQKFNYGQSGENVVDINDDLSLNLEGDAWFWAGAGTVIAVTIIGHIWETAIIFGLMPWAGVVFIIAGLVALFKGDISWVDKAGIVIFECSVWEPQRNGSNCEKCMEGETFCSEYKCHSLGKACKFEEDEEGNSICWWENRNDISDPIITADPDALPIVGYEYIDLSTPTREHVKIASTSSPDGCISPYQKVSFGIVSTKPVECRWDIARVRFEEMENQFGRTSRLKFKHDQSISIPRITEGDETEFRIYVQCIDSSEYEKEGGMAFSFCVDERLDMLPPEILETDPLNGAHLQTGTTNLSVSVFTDKPAECLWSKSNQDDFHNMPSENNFTEGEHSPTIIQGQMAFEYITNLTGLNSQLDNRFYFLCRNNPNSTDESERFAMTQSYPYLLKKTEPIIIDYIFPVDETFYGQNFPVRIGVEARTSGGAEDGLGICYIGETEEDYDFFELTGSKEHYHDLIITETSPHEYFVKCQDSSNNIDETKINFTIEIDGDLPVISRVYRKGNNMKIITHESAVCVYSTQGRDYPFEEGTSITSVNQGTVHYFPWNSETDFFIKCEDEHGNRPPAGECSIIVRAQDLT